MGALVAGSSLQRLGTDCVDHFQMHLPDEQTPLEDTLATLEDLQAEGKVREIAAPTSQANG